MFHGFSQETVDFMWGIRFNNEKSWFDAHKREYLDHLDGPMRALGGDVYDMFSEKHPELGLQLHVCRIYRDARRLHGRGPYKDHLWFTIRKAEDEWTDSPVFWFELDPDKWNYGLGYYSSKAITMAKHRARIDRDPKPLEKLARLLGEQREFILEGESYARPKGDPGKLLRDWYNMKNFSLIHEDRLTEEIYSPELAARVAEGFSFLVPFYDYFSTLYADPDPD